MVATEAAELGSTIDWLRRERGEETSELWILLDFVPVKGP